MRTKTILTILLFVVMGAAASLKAQQYDYIAFYNQTSAGNSDNMKSGNLTSYSYPYFSSPAVVEFALEVTGNMFPMPDIFFQLNSYQRITYTPTVYGQTIYGTLTVQGQTYNPYHLTINPLTTTGSGTVNVRIRIIKIVSGNPYARIGSPTELSATLTK